MSVSARESLPPAASSVVTVASPPTEVLHRTVCADCADVSGRWRASYETLTGKAYDETRERTRCVAVAAGLQEMVRSGCTLPTCAPAVACATFC